MARLHPAASKSSKGETAPSTASLHRKDSATKADAPPRTLKALNTLIAESKPLVPGAKRAVLGEGPVGAAVAFVGEQPGDQEDRQGRPFVGPAGQLLDRAMAEAGLDRAQRLRHQCRQALQVRAAGKAPHPSEANGRRSEALPLVAGPGTQTRPPENSGGAGLYCSPCPCGKSLPISRFRGRADFDGRPGFITVHPSYLLRMPDKEAKQKAYGDFVRDLRSIRKLAGTSA